MTKLKIVAAAVLLSSIGLGLCALFIMPLVEIAALYN